MQTAIDYISSKGWEFKRQGSELILKECPFCHDTKFHFYIEQAEGLFFCHKCQERGNLLTLKRHNSDIGTMISPAFKRTEYKKPSKDQAEKYHQQLLRDTEALSYMESRGINGESTRRFKLGLYQGNGARYLTIPHIKNEEAVNIKFRSLPPAEKDFKRIPGCRSILFNGDAIKGQKEAFVTEGELDAITLIQEGKENVVSGTTGAGSFDPEWIDQLKHLEKIYLVYDPDEAGQKGARSLAKRLGYERCFNIELPEGQDVNDFFYQGGTIEAFNELVAKAHKFDLPGVISTDTAIDLLRREKSDSQSHTGLLTQWENVNRLIKGFYPGDLIILSAPPKTGKTSFALDIARHLSFLLYPVLFFCLEMRPERLVKKLIQAEFREPHLSRENLDKAGQDFAGLPLYFAHSFKKQKLEDVLELIREAIKRYDLKFVVFDNVHFLIRSISNVNEELGQAVQGFKLLAEEMEIPIMLIAQPRKREGSNRDEIMRAEDIKYSNSVHADCDQMIILFRKRVASTGKDIDQDGFTAATEALDPVTLVRIEAHRYGAGGEALLYFHGDYSRYDPIDRGKE